MTGFWFAQLFGLVQDFQDLRASQQKEAALRQSDDKIAIKQLRADRLWIYNSIVVKVCSPLFPDSSSFYPPFPSMLSAFFTLVTCSQSHFLTSLDFSVPLVLRSLARQSHLFFQRLGTPWCYPRWQVL